MLAAWPGHPPCTSGPAASRTSRPSPGVSTPPWRRPHALRRLSRRPGPAGGGAPAPGVVPDSALGRPGRVSIDERGEAPAGRAAPPLRHRPGRARCLAAAHGRGRARVRSLRPLDEMQMLSFFRASADNSSTGREPLPSVKDSRAGLGRARWRAWRSRRADGASGRSGRPGRVQPPDQPVDRRRLRQRPPGGPPARSARFRRRLAQRHPAPGDDFTVIVPDRPGYGRTGGTAANFEGNAARLAELLDGLGVERAIVTGYSWAGGVALAFGEMFPERTAGLVLAASVGPGEDFRWEDRVLAAPLVGEAVGRPHVGDARPPPRQPVGPARGRPTTVPESPGDGQPCWAGIDRGEHPHPGMAGVRDRAAGSAPGSRQPRIPPGGRNWRPGVINGSADRLVPPRVGDALAAAIPGAIHMSPSGTPATSCRTTNRAPWRRQCAGSPAGHAWS